VPGWDCHGLPIELKVEKKVGKAGTRSTPAEFRRPAATTPQAGRGAAQDFIRLGVLGDWDNPYLTMDFRFEADIIRALGRIIANGHLHKGFKPVHWCTDCGSRWRRRRSNTRTRPRRRSTCASRARRAPAGALPAWSWREGRGRVGGDLDHHAVDLPANQAVALNPELDYVLVQWNRGRGPERLVLAEALLKDAAALRHRDYRRSRPLQGRELEGT
jgi:isoleucyl-tRNA synthetase